VVWVDGEELSVDGDGGTETHWKAWIGRASKNSCAIMNGVFSGAEGVKEKREVSVWEVERIA
jgi:hypothetical protein